MFCPKCDGVLVPKDGNLLCVDCDYSGVNEKGTDHYIIKEEVKHTEKSRIEVVEKPSEIEGISQDVREELREQYREAID